MRLLHPHGLQCPQGHPLPAGQAPHDGHRLVVDYRCRQCGAVFNLFTGTIFSKSRYSCAIILQILRGIAQGIPTAHLAAELQIDRSHLLRRRHAIHALLVQRLPPPHCSPTRPKRVMKSRSMRAKRAGNRPIRPVRPVDGPTNARVMAPGPMTVRRSTGLWAGPADRSGCGCCATAVPRHCAP